LLIVGFNAQARGLAAKFDSCPELGYRILGFVSADGDEASVVPQGTDAARWNICGRVSELQTILERTSVDELLICLPLNRCYSTIGQIVRLGEQLGIVVRVIPDPESEAPLLRRTHLEFFEGQFVVVFFRESLLFQLMIKRLVDIVASLTLLVMLSPLLAVVAILIKLTSKGPILFVQQRVGMNRRLFKLYKFRSMTADADRRKEELLALNEMDGPVFKIKNDPRVTPFGRFIRKTSIDELPQLFNVFGGSMSLVGPRPPVPSEVEKYEWLFHRRLSIRPGITCLWQVAGRNEISFKEWMELDKEYVTNWSVWLDLKILCRTIPVVLMCRGAS
jgi:exopolysaccharide biosynthesis polyprenyl glycosylphosphotransferase